MIRQTYSRVSEANLLPKLINVKENLIVANFFLMKLLPASYILDRAREENLIKEGSRIIETTSGTFGRALAILCAERGYELILVSDPAIDNQLKRCLEDLGARVEIVEKPARVGGFQRARLDRMAELQTHFPNHFSPSQYANPYNPKAYAPFVELLNEAVGPINCLVGSVGSGGSMSGTGNYLRRFYPNMRAIGVDTFGSVLFGQPDAKRSLRGLGNSLMPPNLDHTIFDEVHWVSAAAAFRATREIHRKHALFVGPTSGATFLAADWWASRNPDSITVALLPDEGYRYIDTVYQDSWLTENGLDLSKLPDEPQLVSYPHEAKPEWANIMWNRRTYKEVLGNKFETEV